MGRSPISSYYIDHKEKIMASLSLRHIYKVYDGDTRAVSDFCMEIRDREFIVFVGPSGCGKSTTLRMIAGLEDISAGELRIDGVTVNDMEPRDRNIAMVFQNYALYPHMTVYENMAFSLKTARMPRDIIHEKVTEAARILGITEYLSRKPRALSGGQRQRVALGRAIVRNPKVFLFDEPLSNLDAKLRADMRAEIIRLYERLGTTFIYVTHDQVEAMTMGSRIVVMRGGVVQQIDTPKNLFNHPANRFVAGFIGTPRMNFWPAKLTRQGGDILMQLDAGEELTVSAARLSRLQSRYTDGAHAVTVGVRPDDIRPWDGSMSADTHAALDITVTVVEVLGGETLIYGRIGDAATRDGEIILKASAEAEVHRGDALRVGVDKRRLHLFEGTEDSGKSLLPRIPRENICSCEVKDGEILFAGQRFSLPPALADAKGGAGELTLPCDAILIGTGAGRAEVAAAETVEDTERAVPLRLYRLVAGGESFFLSAEIDGLTLAVGDTVCFMPDFARITAPGITPLPRTVTLSGRLDKEKRPREGGRGSDWSFFLDISGRRVEAAPALREKLFSCKGSAVFRLPLLFSFPSEAATLSAQALRDGLPAKVEALYDYGQRTYVRVSVGGQDAVIPADTDGKRPSVGATVYLSVDQNRLSVTDGESGIVIV